MCGIVAAISKTVGGFPYKTKSIFSQMLYANALRGFDSTGVFGINKYGNLKMVKSAQQAADFLRTKTVDNFINDIFKDFRIVVGHNRASTKGATNDTNAHPFIEGTTCLIHNGTLHNHKHLKNVDVDSHAICHAIDAGDYKEVIPELDGAFALIWYDAKKKQLNISRNKERPLWIVETPDVDYIASEPEMLEWLLFRNGLTKVETKYFEVDHVYSYDLDNLKDGFSVEKLPEKKRHPVVVAGKTTITVTQNTTSGNNSKVCYYKNYSYGDTVLLKHETNTINTTTHVFRGNVEDAYRTQWCATTTLDEGKELASEDYLVGTIRGISWKAGVPTLIIEKLTAQEMYLSTNGILVSEQDVAEHGGMCDTCGNWIDMEAEKFWVRYRSNRVKTMKCQTCIEKDPILSKQLENPTYVC